MRRCDSVDSDPDAGVMMCRIYVDYLSPRYFAHLNTFHTIFLAVDPNETSSWLLSGSELPRGWLALLAPRHCGSMLGDIIC